jgi:ribonuclease P protein component
MKKYTFTKEERLCSQKQIELLFNNSSSFILYPFRFVWTSQTLADAPYPAEIAISVPKKRFKRAVDRNKIKRHIREAYRKNKGELFYPFLSQQHIKLSFILIYVSNELFTAVDMEKKLILCLNKFIKEYAKVAE